MLVGGATLVEVVPVVAAPPDWVLPVHVLLIGMLLAPAPPKHTSRRRWSRSRW